jgi:Primase X
LSRNVKLSRQAWEGLDFIMEILVPSSYDGGSNFPRTISTGATRGRQYTVQHRTEAMTYYEAAIYEDCFLNAYPNYQWMRENKRLPPTFTPVPNYILIDLDRAPFNSDEELATALKETLQNIKRSFTDLASESHVVIASGSGGYHIHVPLAGWTTPLQEMPEFEAFKDDPDLANNFLRFAERKLTNGRADHCHNPSIKSAMFRIPGTFNTKARAAGKDPLVRVVAGDGNGIEYTIRRICIEQGLPPELAAEELGKPTTQFLNDFHAYLVQQRINDKIIKSEKRVKSLTLPNQLARVYDSILWIDRLLSEGIEDHRKDILYWVLAPYLITVRKMDHDKAAVVLEQWLEKCDAIRSLEPGWSYFRYRINYCIDNAYRNERLPIKFQTFQEYYPDLIGDNAPIR